MVAVDDEEGAATDVEAEAAGVGSLFFLPLVNLFFKLFISVVCGIQNTQAKGKDRNHTIR